MLSNYNNLHYFITIKKLLQKQARWAKDLAKYNFKIKYKLRPKNLANSLLRRPNYRKGFLIREGKAIRNTILLTL